MTEHESVIERPSVSAPGPWSFPDAQRAGLSNGLAVVSYDIPGQYVISVRLAVPMPLDREPRDREASPRSWLGPSMRGRPGIRPRSSQS